MLVLGIETTCDETAASIVEDGEKILSHVVFSQASIHKKYGGVFPEIASRSHVKKILPVIDDALSEAKITPDQIDLIAVASGPGLIGSLLIGVNTAKTLSFVWKKPLIGVNHVEAHLYAAMMGNLSNVVFPSLGVVVSGGHTMILLIEALGKYTLLGQTIDDALGEAFDKVATILGLSYPGGPAIESLAKSGNPLAYPFKAGKVTNSLYDFSFSGLKTKVLYTVKGQKASKNSPLILDEKEKPHLAASFQRAAFSDLIEKTLLAHTNHSSNAIYLGGGVSNNQKLKEMFLATSPIPCYFPPLGLSLDNAAMIAGLGYQKFLTNKTVDGLSLEAKSRWAFA
jgi:N6-L-threonylcarbamoyladenine synthase